MNEANLSSFRTDRYALLNKARWDQFLSMGIPLAGKTVFEPGAGIGDQTEWLLNQGVKHIYVNDGRGDNLEAIIERFSAFDGHGMAAAYDSRLTFVQGDLERCLVYSEFQFKVDFIFCYGVYYHLNEAFPSFPIMKALANMGETIALDYLTGDDGHCDYGYDNPSTSLSQFAFRPRTETLMKALKEIWGYAYLPKNQLKWVDPVSPENRLVAVASHSPSGNTNLELQ